MANQKAQPAFPTWINDDAMQAGMTLRDYFAAASLQGLLASNPDYFPHEIAATAYKYADLMLEQRNVR